MMRLLALGFLLAANVAMADAPAAPPQTQSGPSSPVPLSIWRVENDGGVEHLQSGLSCPARFGNYRRNRLDLYSRFGLDVSCNYVDGTDDITLYLTRPDGASLDDAYAEAKRELLQFGVKKQPVLISESSAGKDGLTWKTAVYSEDGGLHSGIWLADLAGWFLEFRATYPAESETAVLADISSLTDVVRKSAGGRLALCAKAVAPKRSGSAVTDKAALSQYAMMSSVTGGLTAGSQDAKTPQQPIVWCAEKPIVQGDLALLFWRGVRADGGDAEIDRITMVTLQAPPTLQVARDALTSLVEAGGKGDDPKDLWTASLEQGGKTAIFGYFDGRPTPESVSSLFGEILAGRAKPLIVYAGRGDKLTIELPSKN